MLIDRFFILKFYTLLIKSCFDLSGIVSNKTLNAKPVKEFFGLTIDSLVVWLYFGCIQIYNEVLFVQFFFFL